MQPEETDLTLVDIPHQPHKATLHSKIIAVCIANGTLSGFNQSLLLILPIAIFLPYFSTSLLPLVYAGIIIINFVLHKMHERFSYFIKSARPTFFYSILSAILVAALWWDLVHHAHTWAKFALLVVSVPLISLGNMQLSELNRSLSLNNMYSIRKTINICQLAAIGLGGLIAPLLILTLGVTNSLIILCGSFFIHSIFVYFSPKFPIQENEDIVENHLSHHGSRDTTIYIIKLFIYSGIGVFGFYIINILFNTIIKSEFINSENIGLFMSGFFAVIGFLSLALHVFINKYLVNRLGIAILLNLWPSLIIIVATIIVVFMPSPIIIVPAIIAMQLIDEILKRGTLGEIRSLIHQPLSPEDRSWIENKARPIIRLVAGVTASATIFILYSYYGMDITLLSMTIIVASAVMLYLIPGIKKLYTFSLVKALGKHHLVSPDFTILDKTSLGLLKSALKSPHTEVALYSLNVLEKTNTQFLPKAIEYCLQHKNKSIRIHALTKIRKHHFSYLKKDIFRCIDNDPSPDVRGEALVTLSTVVGSSAIPMLRRYLNDDEPTIRAGAIIGLLQFCGTDGALLASDKLRAMVEYPVPNERLLAAKILNAIDIREFHNALKTLLEDDNYEVRKVALDVASKIPSPDIIDILISYLDYPELRVTAMHALSKFGKLAVKKLESALEENESIPDIFSSITVILSQIDSPAARDILYRYIDHPNAKVRHSCFSALHQYHFTATTEIVHNKINDLLKKEAVICIDILETLTDIDETLETSILINLLKSQFKQQQENIIYLLSFYYPEQGVMRAWNNLQANNNEIAKYGIELLDGLLTTSHKNLLIPLLENNPPAIRIQRLPQSQIHQQRSMPDRLRFILNKTTYLNPLIQASALYAATKMKLSNTADIAKEKIHNPNPIIRETALWSLWFLRNVDFAENGKRLLTDPSQIVANTAKQLTNQ